MLRRCFPRFSAASATTTKADVVIIGSGVIGSYTALELARTGAFARVIIVDSNKSPATGNSTCYSSGIIRSFYAVRESAALAWEAYHVWRNIQDHLGLTTGADVAKMRQAPLWLPPTVDASKFLPVAEQLKIPVQKLSAEETLHFAETHVAGYNVKDKLQMTTLEDDDFATVRGERSGDELISHVLPETGYVTDPGLASANAATAANTFGGMEFMYGTRVTGFRKSGGRIAGVEAVSRAGKVSIEAPIVINAAGPWSASLTKLLPEIAAEMTVSTRPLRAECAVLNLAEGKSLNCVTFDPETGTYARPEGKGRILIGGLDMPSDPMEKELLYPPLEEADAIVSGGKSASEVHDTILTPCSEQLSYHLHRTSLRLPAAEIPRRPPSFASYYDVSDDWSPIIDGSTALPGYFMAIGTSGNCFKLAPLVGKIMAQIVVNKQKSSAAAPLLELPLTGQVFDPKVFAMNRRILKDSSNSVIG